jgi:hypothetical protein
MITLQQAILELLAEKIVLANSGAFLWRKLVDSPTIQYLAKNEDPEELESSLKQVLANDSLTEDMQTSAYAYMVALLSRTPAAAETVAKLPGIEKLHLARSLLAHVGRFSASSVPKITMTKGAGAANAAPTSILIVPETQK